MTRTFSFGETGESSMITRPFPISRIFQNSEQRRSTIRQHVLCSLISIQTMFKLWSDCVLLYAVTLYQTTNCFLLQTQAFADDNIDVAKINGFVFEVVKTLWEQDKTLVIGIVPFPAMC